MVTPFGREYASLPSPALAQQMVAALGEASAQAADPDMQRTGNQLASELTRTQQVVTRLADRMAQNERMAQQQGIVLSNEMKRMATGLGRLDDTLKASSQQQQKRQQRQQQQRPVADDYDALFAEPEPQRRGRRRQPAQQQTQPQPFSQWMPRPAAGQRGTQQQPGFASMGFGAPPPPLGQMGFAGMPTGGSIGQFAGRQGFDPSAWAAQQLQLQREAWQAIERQAQQAAPEQTLRERNAARQRRERLAEMEQEITRGTSSARELMQHRSGVLTRNIDDLSAGYQRPEGWRDQLKAAYEVISPSRQMDQAARLQAGQEEKGLALEQKVASDMAQNLELQDRNLRKQAAVDQDIVNYQRRLAADEPGLRPQELEELQFRQQELRNEAQRLRGAQGIAESGQRQADRSEKKDAALRKQEAAAKQQTASQMSRQFNQLLRGLTVTAAAGAAAVTFFGLSFGNLALQLEAVHNRSQTTGVALHQLGTGIEALTGIRTTAADLERFEAVQRRVVALMQSGQAPARQQIISFSRLGIAVGGVTEVNEQLYNRMAAMPLAIRELDAEVAGISQGWLAAMAAGYSYDQAMRSGVELTREQQQAAAQTRIELNRLQVGFQEIAAELGGPMLTALTAFKQIMLPIGEAVGNFVANNSRLIGGLAGVAAGFLVLKGVLMVLQPVLSAVMLLKTAIGMLVTSGGALWPLALATGGAALAIGGLGIAGALNLGSSISDAMTDLKATMKEAQVEANRESRNEEKAEAAAGMSGRTMAQLADIDAGKYHPGQLINLGGTGRPGQPGFTGSAAELERYRDSLIYGVSTAAPTFPLATARPMPELLTPQDIAAAETRMRTQRNIGAAGRWYQDIKERVETGGPLIGSVNFYGPTDAEGATEGITEGLRQGADALTEAGN